MKRVFLSHSSHDKTFVEPIAELLGKINCVYDKFTFEIGSKTIQQIFSELDETDIFVYFISEYSLQSNWVNDELNKAQELLSNPEKKLSQIFPIIIDPTIFHSDDRIAPFLRKQYNLQHVSSSVIAYRKIVQQIAKFDFDNQLLSSSTLDNYYGRDEEINAFKKRIDVISPIKSAVISGIPGIGKKSFIRHALIQSKIIKPYYSPIVISMPKNGSIEDLILLLSEAGFASYSLQELSSISNMDEKIDILTNIINQIQQYKEIVIIEDDETLVSINGDIKYWFINAIKKSANGIGVIVSSNITVDPYSVRNQPEVHFANLKELSATEKMGLFRSYSETLGLDLSLDDRNYFRDCLTGYPRQILFCAELIKEQGIEYAKDHTEEIAAIPEQISSMVIEKCQSKIDKKYIDGILSIVVKMEIAPVKLLNKIFKANENYRIAIGILRKYSVCYVIGANGEYIKMNSFIENFISRNKIEIPSDIQGIVENEIVQFNDSISNNPDPSEWDSSELRFYIKENIKRGIQIPGTFIYSTVILQTISELYHEQKYPKLIEIIQETKSNDRYQYFDNSVKRFIQRFYCQALIKTRNANFNAELGFFSDEQLWSDYYFLKGFWNRYIGDYNNAEKWLTKVFDFPGQHYAAKRELIIVYLSIQDFETALSLAKSNYSRPQNKENLFAIQAYLECLLELKSRTQKQEEEIEEMLVTLGRIHRAHHSQIYYQLMSKYQAFHENNISLALKYIEQGIKDGPLSPLYLYRDKFDIYRRFNNIQGMEETLPQLSKSVEEYEYKGVVLTRKAILDLYKGKTVASVKLELKDNGFSEKAIENVIKKCPTAK